MDYPIDVYHCIINEDRIVNCYHNYGFYSITVETFSAIISLLNRGIVPENVSYKNACYFYKRNESHDIFPDVFSIECDKTSLPINQNIPIPHCNTAEHSFNQNDIKKYHDISKVYFNASEDVNKYFNYLVNNYSIDFDKTISVYYRGTDKGIEVKLASYEEYYEICKSILDKNPDFKILIQSDQTQFIEYFKDKFGDSCFSFDELIHVTGNQAIFTILKSINCDPLEQVQLFDAAIRCVSKCKHLICGTGNVSLFAKIYRGSTSNVYTFDEFGKLNYGQ